MTKQHAAWLMLGLGGCAHSQAFSSSDEATWYRCTGDKLSDMLRLENDQERATEPEILAAAVIYQCTDLFEPIRNNGAYKNSIKLIRERRREMEQTIEFDQGARSLREI